MGRGVVRHKEFLTHKQKLIIIVGPTASGKSALAVRLARYIKVPLLKSHFKRELAEKYNGAEIISADSRQVYRGLDIGTGKVTTKEMAGVRHHLLDAASPRRAFTAAQFKNRAARAIRGIARRGRTPIIAGGTAFWIDTLVYDLTLPAVKPNAVLRRRLEKNSPAELFALLKKLDPKRAAGIEKGNPRRLIRAIEIARALGYVPKSRKHAAYDTLWIGIQPPYEAKPRRVERRIRAMVRKGLIAETKRLIRQGVSEKRIREFGFEYTAALDAITENLPRAELERRIKRDTRRYAKRQMRWWKRNPEIHWISPVRSKSRRNTETAVVPHARRTSNGVSDPRKAERLVRLFLKKS